MKKRMFKVPKILFAYVIMALFGVNMVANAAGEAVTIEGKHLVRNATNNEMTYTDTTNAKVGDTLRYMAWYHNTENENSGLNAENLNVKITIPNTKTNAHITTARIAGNNTNVVSDTAMVTTNEDTILEYVPGSAVRRYNSGTNAAPNWITVNIDDSVVTTGYTVTSMKPCWNFEESIVISVRVVRPVVVPAPTCAISATPSTIERGNSAVLNFSSTNATSGSISGIGSVGTSGNRTVSPTITTNYTYNVIGEGGTASCSTTIIVTEGKGEPVLPVCTIYSTPGLINKGESSILTFDSANAISGSISGIGSVGTRGTKTVTPSADTTYVYTVVGEDGSASCNTTVRVKTPSEGKLPESGPAEAAAGAVGLTAAGGAGYSWLRSKKALLSALKKIK